MIISQPRSLVLGLSLALAACGGEGLTLPPDGEAANIDVTWGDEQSARVNSPLPDSVVVRVTDTQDRPVAGAEVVFDFTANGSSATPATVSTDANGIAWSRLALGSRAGTVSGTVGVPVPEGVTPVQTTITATALAANANGIAMVSGDIQSGQVGTELPAPLVVSVTDASGNPIPGVTVDWTVTGGGSVSAATTQTGANGQASVTRTLGPTAGPQTATATAAGLAGSPVNFAHTATAGSATGVVKVSGDGQSALVGTELANPLVVQVLDAQGNPIPNRAVTWVTGEGSVNPENTSTNAQGNASTRWTLGPTPGAKSANAVVSGVGTATFSATATAGSPSGTASSVSASPGTINAGSGSSTITVTVRDGSNNPVGGVSVTPVSSGTGNSFTPTSAASGGNGVATFSFSSTVAETKTIRADAGGVEITDQATVTVQKVSSTVEITNDDPDPSTVGQNVVVEFTASGSGGPPSGNVVITINGGASEETCTGALTNGSGSCSLPVTQPGTGSNNRRVILATYGGDARFSGDTDTENHTVNPPISTNLPPVAGNDGPYPATEDTPLVVAAPGVLSNDTDPELGPLTATDASNPPNGSVTLNQDGSFTYTPDDDFFGNDQFTYSARDAAGNTTVATVTIAVSGVNDAPSFTGGDDDAWGASAIEPATVNGWATAISRGAANESSQALIFIITTDNDALFGMFPTISAEDGTLTYRGNGTTGVANVTVQLQDDGGGTNTSATDTFVITFFEGQLRLKPVP